MHDAPSDIDLDDGFDLAVIKNRDWYNFATNISNSGDVSFDASILNGIGNAYKILLISESGGWTSHRGTISVGE